MTTWIFSPVLTFYIRGATDPRNPQAGFQASENSDLILYVGWSALSVGQSDFFFFGMRLLSPPLDREQWLGLLAGVAGGMCCPFLLAA